MQGSGWWRTHEKRVGGVVSPHEARGLVGEQHAVVRAVHTHSAADVRAAGVGEVGRHLDVGALCHEAARTVVGGFARAAEPAVIPVVRLAGDVVAVEGVVAAVRRRALSLHEADIPL